MIKARQKAKVEENNIKLSKCRRELQLWVDEVTWRGLLHFLRVLLFIDHHEKDEENSKKPRLMAVSYTHLTLPTIYSV